MMRLGAQRYRICHHALPLATSVVPNLVGLERASINEDVLFGMNLLFVDSMLPHRGHVF